MDFESKKPEERQKVEKSKMEKKENSKVGTCFGTFHVFHHFRFSVM